MSDQNNRQSQPSHGKGNAEIHRQPTAEELKKHAAEHPKIFKGIQASHAQTMHKVRRMQGRILWNDKGA